VAPNPGLKKCELSELSPFFCSCGAGLGFKKCAPTQPVAWRRLFLSL
jgi:hypothetical protein